MSEPVEPQGARHATIQPRTVALCAPLTIDDQLVDA